MKKTLLSLLALATAAVVSAQTITFVEGEGHDANTEKTYGTGDFTVVSKAGSKAIAIDGNNANFGKAEVDGYVKYSTRWKSGGKSSKGVPCLVVNCPSAGTLKIAARTGSNSETNRTVVVTQGETELYNKVVEESLKSSFTPEGAEEPISVYPYIEIPVTETCQLTITFPIGSINIYGFVFEASSETPGEGGDEEPNSISKVEAEVISVEYFTLTGVKVDEPTKGINIVKTTYSDNSVKTQTIVK